MSLILALTFATIIVLLRIALKVRPNEYNEPVLVERYIHRGHSWMKVTHEGDVIVGIDDFGQSVIGLVQEVKLPRLLHRVQQGEVGWTVRHGGEVVPMRSPVSGRVIEKNEMVMHNPALINAAPYGDGWLFKVRPKKLESQLRNLITGRIASKWQDLERAELAGMFSRTPALMFQEGGTLLQNLSERCSKPEWAAIAQRFFLVDLTSD